MGKQRKWTLEEKVKIVKDFKKGVTISYLNNKYGISGTGTVSRWNQEYDKGIFDVDNRGKRKSQQEIADIISEEHESVKGIYGTIRLKKHIENKLKMILNHKLIRRYKHILGLETLKRTKKGLSISRAKEKNLKNKAQYLIECNFKSDKPGQKFSSDVSYIKCIDGHYIYQLLKITSTKKLYHFLHQITMILI